MSEQYSLPRLQSEPMEWPTPDFSSSSSPETSNFNRPEADSTVKRKRNPRGVLNTRKCQDCRRSKLKCTPADRVWPDKCTRCEEKGLPCSENTKARRTRREKPATTVDLETITDAAHTMVNLGLPPRPEVWTQAIFTHCVSLLRLLARAAKKQREEMEKLKSSFALWPMHFYTTREKCSPITDWQTTSLRQFINKFQTTVQRETLRQLGLEVTESQRSFLGQILTALHLPCSVPYDEEGSFADPCICGKSNLRAAVVSLRQAGDYGGALALWEHIQAHSAENSQDTFVEHRQLRQGFRNCVAEITDLVEDEYWSHLMTNDLFLLDYTNFRCSFILEDFTIGAPDSTERDCLGKNSSHILLEILAECGSHRLPESLDPVLQKDFIEAGRVSDDMGQNLFHMACLRDFEDVVNLCIKAGYDINRTTTYGSTALHYAVASGDRSICRILMDAGADLNATDNVGATPLHYAICKGSRSNTLLAELLISKVDRTSFSLPTTQGHTPFNLAVGKGQTSVVEQMLDILGDGGLDKHPPDDNQETHLHLAVRTGSSSMVRQIGRVQDLDVNHRNVRGETALIVAVCSSHQEIVKMLLDEVFVRASIVDHQGNSALHHSIRRGHWIIYQMLIQRSDCGLRIRNKDGQLPWDIAMNGPNDVIKEHMARMLEASG